MSLEHCGESALAPPRVALLAGSLDEVAALQRRLLADSMESELLDFSVLASYAPDSWLVVVAYLSTPVTQQTVHRLIAWSRGANRPVGMIGYSPRGVAEDCERALEAGFDDVIVGRDSPRELSARVRALARRLGSTGSVRSQRMVFGRLSLDLERHEMTVGAYKAALTPLELLLVKCLIETAGRPVTREELLLRIWGTDNVNVGLRAVDNLVWRLRRKLGPIHVFGVVRGVGFQLLR
jgi:DNA-binding response OmpR family regulator